MTSCGSIEISAETPNDISARIETNAETPNDIMWVDRNQRRDPE